MVITHFVDAVPRLPAKLLEGLVAGGVTRGDIARPSVGYDIRYLFAACLFKGFDGLQHADAVARPQIVGREAAALNFFERGQMPRRKVCDVDIVPDARAVRRGVIAAEHRQLFKPARRHLRDIGHQIVRYALGVLAYQAALVRADRVEITQNRYAEGFVGGI